MDYAKPEYHLATRGPVNPDLIPGMLPADRAAWDKTPLFLGWPAQFQRVHATMTEASARLVKGLEAVLDAPDGSAQELLGLTGMNRLGVDLVDRVSHHHAYEDTAVLPRFLSAFPAMAHGVALLDQDHDVLHAALVHARRAFAALDARTSPKSEIALALKDAVHLQRILHRHTYDEEDLLIPAVLEGHVHL